MATPTERQAARMAQRARARLVEDLERLLADSGIGVTTLARHAGLSHGYVSDILAGRETPTLQACAKLAVPLGADLTTRLYPNTGPTIRDRHQARILEAVLALLHPRWRVATEASVWKPVRGTIDAVLHDPRAGVVVATEIESDLRRIDQTVRWSAQKAEALPSWAGWAGALSEGADAASVSRLLVVRRTRANRTRAAEFARQLMVAYPAHPADALAALRGDGAWPGAALIWVAIEPERVRFLETRA